jgi:hypothetical protein
MDLKRGAEQGKAKWLRHFFLHFKKLLNASIQHFFHAKSQSFPIGFS